MQDPRILGLISKHLASNLTLLEKDELQAWLSEKQQNKDLMAKIKTTWQNGEEEKISLRKRFSRKRITQGLVHETLANLVGFVIGMWVSSTFSHVVKERKSFRNLFGLLGQKKKVVNDIPEWMQFTLSVLLGFLALELILYFFQSNKHLLIWQFCKTKWTEWRKSESA